jgi:3-methyladenine DNA glycosylase AlkD
VGPDALVARLRAAFEAERDPIAAEGMAAYMRDQFPFVGIKTPARRVIGRRIMAELDRPDDAELRAAAEACWAQREREFQYFACDYLSRHVDRLTPSAVRWSAVLLTTKPWWDTVDALASHVVGGVVRRHREQVAVMDEWIDDRDIWLARTAILHQLGWKADTDADRLFDYARRRAGDTEFFIRKAIGWALREYSKTDGDAVERFVEDHEAELSGLSRREALKVIERRRPEAPSRSRP